MRGLCPCLIRDVMQQPGVVLAFLLWTGGGWLAAEGELVESLPVLLWWTPFSDEAGAVIECGVRRCLVTDSRAKWSDPQLGAILFYGSNFEKWDLPVPRSRNVLWALLHEESPKNAPVFCHDDAISLFNVTSTFRSGSDFPLTLQYLESLSQLTSSRNVVSFGDKLAADSLAPVVYLASGCDNPLERDRYVRQLQRFIAVDSYGACLHNRDLPSGVDAFEGRDPPELDTLLSRYLFYLALENAACPQYITEKLWRPLRLGVLPVYAGAPDVQAWLPNPDSAILVSNFSTLQKLAEYMHRLRKNESLYEAYRRHKRDVITNQRLAETLNERAWVVHDGMSGHNYVEAFQCGVCERLWDIREGKATPRWANSTHYGCPRPVALLGAESEASWWAEQWDHAATEAAVLRQSVLAGQALSRDQFYDRVLRQLNGRDEL